MEPWIFYAIFGVIFAGLYNFVFKIVAERNYNSYLFTAWDYFFSAIFVGIYMIPHFSNYLVNQESFLLILSLAMLNVIFFSFSLFTRIESMRNIDTVIFYPLYKTFGPIIITIISFFFLKENLALKEFFGIVLGITVPLMLITKTENKIQKNLLLGVILVAATAVLSSIAALGAKGLMLYGLNIELFLLLSFVAGVVISALSNKVHNYKGHKKYNLKGMKKLALLAGALHVLSALFFTLSMFGNMAVAFTINSFSILIPIILSIIFYGEDFNMRKGIVILLSIISILMFL